MLKSETRAWRNAHFRWLTVGNLRHRKIAHFAVDHLETSCRIAHQACGTNHFIYGIVLKRKGRGSWLRYFLYKSSRNLAILNFLNRFNDRSIIRFRIRRYLPKDSVLGSILLRRGKALIIRVHLNHHERGKGSHVTGRPSTYLKYGW